MRPWRCEDYHRAASPGPPGVSAGTVRDCPYGIALGVPNLTVLFPLTRLQRDGYQRPYSGHRRRRVHRPRPHPGPGCERAPGPGPGAEAGPGARAGAGRRGGASGRHQRPGDHPAVGGGSRHHLPSRRRLSARGSPGLAVPRGPRGRNPPTDRGRGRRGCSALRALQHGRRAWRRGWGWAGGRERSHGARRHLSADQAGGRGRGA
jgi:hypothetical protein